MSPYIVFILVSINEDGVLLVLLACIGTHLVSVGSSRGNSIPWVRHVGRDVHINQLLVSIGSFCQSVWGTHYYGSTIAGSNQ